MEGPEEEEGVPGDEEVAPGEGEKEKKAGTKEKGKEKAEEPGEEEVVTKTKKKKVVTETKKGKGKEKKEEEKEEITPGAYEGTTMITTPRKAIVKGIVSDIVRVRGPRGAGAMMLGGPFMGTIGEMSRRMRFSRTAAENPYPRGISIGFRSFENQMNDGAMTSAFQVGDSYYERILDVGNKATGRITPMSAVGASLNPSTGGVVDSTARTAKRNRDFISSNMSEIPLYGTMTITGSFDVDDVVRCTMDYSFVPSIHSVAMRGSLERRIFTLKDDNKVPIAVVHLGVIPRKTDESAKVRSIMIALNRNRGLVRDTGANSLTDIMNALNEGGIPRLLFASGTSKVKTVTKTKAKATKVTGKPGSIIQPIDFPDNSFPYEREYDALYNSARKLAMA